MTHKQTIRRLACEHAKHWIRQMAMTEDRAYFRLCSAMFDFYNGQIA